jgi:hypothetical protein
MDRSLSLAAANDGCGFTKPAYDATLLGILQAD